MAITRLRQGKRRKTPEVVVITAGSAGVGRAVARRFARDGAHIGLLARGVERLEDTRDEICRVGAQALAVPTDVADWDQVEAAATAIETAFGPIDVWIQQRHDVGLLADPRDAAGGIRPRHRRDLFSGRSTERWRRSAGCCRGIAEGSYRSVRRWRIAGFRCSLPIAPPSTRFKGSWIHFGPNSFTTGVPCT